jgi:hypothetical protein
MTCRIEEHSRRAGCYQCHELIRPTIKAGVSFFPIPLSGLFSCSQGGAKITRFLTTGWHIPYKRRVSCLSHSFRAGDSSRFIPVLSGLFSCPQSREACPGGAARPLVLGCGVEFCMGDKDCMGEVST